MVSDIDCIDSIDDLLQVLYLEDQDVLAGVMGVEALRLSNVMSYRVMRPELDDSCTKLIEFLRDSICLSFGAVYIDGELDTGAQMDRHDGSVVPAHWEDVDTGYARIQSPHLEAGDDISRVVHTLRAGDSRPYGVVVFEKPFFCVQDVALIKDAVRKFSSHIENIREKYPLREQVITDDLTGLGNKRRLRRVYLSAVHGWQNQGLHFGLGFGDLDRFKDINTFYGHDYGDMVLQKVADIMRESVGSQGEVCRFGGEEFVIICQGASAEKMDRVARDITNHVREFAFPDGDDGRKAREITMSMGTVSTMEEDLYDRRVINVAMRRLMKAKGYDNRDRIISNVRFDIDTGMASMPLLIPHLKERIGQCCSCGDGGGYGSLAVMNFDIVHFSYWIRELGSDEAFNVFRNLVEWWKGRADDFGYVARDNNRDGIITSLFSTGAGDELKVRVEQRAHEYIGMLRQVPLYSGLRKVDFDFAVGGVVYDPRKVDAAPKPRFLTHAAEVMVNGAAERDDRVLVGFYDGRVPSQLLPPLEESDCVCAELEKI